MRLDGYRRFLILPVAAIGIVALADAFGTLQISSRARQQDPTEAREQILLEQVSKLRKIPTEQLALAGALAELSMVHRELATSPHSRDCGGLLDKADFEARESVRLIDPGDTTSHAYFVSRRALCFALNIKGQHGSKVILPLLDGNWPDLDKATIYDNLAEMYVFPSNFDSQEYALRALKLRMKAAGPNSLEVADSLLSMSDSSGCSRPLPKELAVALQLDKIAPDHSIYPNWHHLSQAYRARAAQIQEENLGSSSLRLAQTLAGMGEQGILRSNEIYAQHYGLYCDEIKLNYSMLSHLSKDPKMAAHYADQAALVSAMQAAGNDPLKRLYVHLKSSQPGRHAMDQNDSLTQAFRAAGVKVPPIEGVKYQYGACGYPLDLKKLCLPELDWLMASCTVGYDSELAFDRMTLEGRKGQRTVFRMQLPSWGGNGNRFVVTGPGRFSFRQQGTPEQGYQEMDYKWNGKAFLLVGGQPGATDAAVVQSAVDDAVTGVGYYGIRGHHSVSTQLVKDALQRADAVALELYKKGDAKNAALRLKTMFELTSDLVAEASTGVSIDAIDVDRNDDVQKWKNAWSYSGSLFSIDLTAADWGPWLKNYEHYRRQSKS